MYLTQTLCKRLHMQNIVFNSKKEQVSTKEVTFALEKIKWRQNAVPTLFNIKRT